MTREECDAVIAELERRNRETRERIERERLHFEFQQRVILAEAESAVEILTRPLRTFIAELRR